MTQTMIRVLCVIKEGTGSLRFYMMYKPNGSDFARIRDTVVEPYTTLHSDAHLMYKTIDFERMRLANIIHINKN